MQHPDRNAQFDHIDEAVRQRLEANEPVISVDTKKKELVGSYKNGGRELRPQHEPEDVNVHDFADKEQNKVAPYGVYDLQRNEAWVSVASATIRRSSPSRPSLNLDFARGREEENARLRAKSFSAGEF